MNVVPKKKTSTKRAQGEYILKREGDVGDRRKSAWG
jgi:hypothetical protein